MTENKHNHKFLFNFNNQRLLVEFFFCQELLKVFQIVAASLV